MINCIVPANQPIYQALIDQVHSTMFTQIHRINAYKNAANIIYNSTDIVYKAIITDMLNPQYKHTYLDLLFNHLDTLFINEIQDFIIHFILENHEINDDIFT